MSKVRLTDPVRLETGEETTIAALADAGRVRFTKTDNWHSSRAATGKRTAYFAELVPEKNDGLEGCWEIGATAYQSRTGEQVTGSATSEQKEPEKGESNRIGDTQGEWIQRIIRGRR